MLRVECECKCWIFTVSWQWRHHTVVPVLLICACNKHIMFFTDAKPLASCVDDGGGCKLSQRAGHHTQTCPSNTWSPWKQPSSKLTHGGCSNIMEEQTELCLHALGCVAFKMNTSSLSFPFRQNETGGENATQNYITHLVSTHQNVQKQKTSRCLHTQCFCKWLFVYCNSHLAKNPEH